MGFSFKYSRLDFTYLREFELANGIGGIGFEIFKITQETKKLASRVPKWASPRGTL